jgi:penicillin G amidase
LISSEFIDRRFSQRIIIKPVEMKTLKRILLVVLVLVIILLIAGTIYIRQIGHAALPDYSATLDLKGIKEEVTVIRDEYAIPHIYAKSEEDLYTAGGYVLAQDRLWQMDLLRRVTLGRLSEIFGDKFVETDLLLRALRYSEKSNRIIASMDSVQLRCLQAFANGINEYIERQGNKLPPEFAILGYKPEPWAPVYSLNLIGYMAWDLKAGWSEMMLEEVRNKVGEDLYRQLLPDLKQEKTHVYPLYTHDSLAMKLQAGLLNGNENLRNLGLEIFHGSNNWAVSGKKSATGKPIVCNDMHLGLNIPGIWYQIHEVIPGKLDVSGLLLPGQPMVICGHNKRIAWGMTNAFVDNVDYYEEKINPQDSMQFMHNGEWMPIKIQKEIIRIKGGKSTERQIKFTQHGPIISKFKNIKDKAVSMHWVGDEMSNEMRTVYLLNRAGNWTEFKDAITSFKAVSQNVVYADIDGNIGLYYAAGIPIRKRDFDGFFLPGWTDEYDWKGWVPFENLPHSFNPPTGYVSSANNNPVGDDYPYYIGRWFYPPNRIDRIRELLEAKKVLSVEDMKMIQTDQHSVLARSMNADIVKELESIKNPDADEKLALSILKNWKDGDMSANLVAPSIFEKCYLLLSEDMMKDEMGEDLFTRYFNEGSLIKFAMMNMWKNPESAWWDDISTPQKETRSDIIRKSIKRTINFLTKTYGKDTADWKWGNIHTLILEHPLASVKVLDKLFGLDRGPFKLGGSSHTIAPFTYPYEKAFAINHAASHRHIFSISNWDESFTVIPTGNSGIPASKNYCDQTVLYINMKYHSEIYSDENVKKHEKFRMTLK